MTAELSKNEKKSTPVNMANHSYFNLSGHNFKGGVLNHSIQINADYFTPSNERSCPTKEVKHVEKELSMDLRKLKNIRDAITDLGKA